MKVGFLLFPFFATAFCAAQKPNVLFISIDDLRPELGCYGNKIIKIPNIDHLAKVGLTFLRTYCQQSVCNPNRASLLSGLRPDSLRAWDFQTDFRNNLPAAITLPQYFNQQGYTTVGLGKTFHNIFPDSISWTRVVHVKGFPFDPDVIDASQKELSNIEEKKKKFIAEGNKSRIDSYGFWDIKANATREDISLQLASGWRKAMPAKR